jgi:predicted AlkP superfamily phosphohydrolase/phosphomutase
VEGSNVKTLVIGLDAADSRLVFEWCREGRLPTLRRLIQRGVGARLSSETGLGSEAVWPTAVTGCLPGKHGIYNWRSIRPGTDQLVRTPSRSYRKPFWWVLRKREPRRRAVVLDVPYVSRVEEEGITEVLGWGQREAVRHHSWPEGLLGELTAEYGRYPRGLEGERIGRPFPPEQALESLMQMTRRRTRLLVRLMSERAWDLCLGVYFEPHYGGHLFYRYLDPGVFSYDRELTRRFEGALLEIYRSCDDAIANLLQAAGDDVNVVVFSGTGMRPVSNGHRVFRSVLTRLGYYVPAPRSLRTRAVGLGRSVAVRAMPRPLAHWIRDRLPERVDADHFERMWRETTDWERTRAYDEADTWHPFVRITVPEPERSRLAEEIADELRALRNADTGEPAAARVLTRDQIARGPHADVLPDLAVHWAEGGMLRRVQHPRLGVIDEDMSGHFPSEHNADGFLIAAGPGIRSREEQLDAHIVDLAPSLLHVLGAPIPEDMDGTPMEGVLATELGAPRRVAIEMGDDPWSQV